MINRYLLIVLCLVVTFVGCKGGDADEPTEAVREAQEYYDLARGYDEGWQMRMAELYYKKAYETLKDDPSQNWYLFGDAGYRYAYLLNERGDIESAVAVVSEILAEDIRPNERATLLMLMGDCQMRLGQHDEAKQTISNAYKVKVSNEGGERKGNFNMLVTCFGIFHTFMETKEYDEASKWLTRMEEEFQAYEQANPNETKLIEEYKGHIANNRALLLIATGHKDEANAVYDAIPASRIYNPLSISNAADYLMTAGRYAEAADMYARLDTTFASIDSAHVTFDMISNNMAPRYLANRRAGMEEGNNQLKGRTAEALRVADMLCVSIDSALAWQKRNDAAELAVIYHTHEKELALRESRVKTVIAQIMAVAALLMLALVVYILWRIRRYNSLLKEKNRFLYKQISKREKAEEEVRESARESKAKEAAPTHNQLIYQRLCELMRNPEVYTDSEANHETLARLAGTNYKYIYDALRECVGQTPADFINQHRIRYAAQLLTTTDDPVGLIAEQCGITNRSTFARLFREHYAMTPTEYRKAAK